jgi:pyruvate,orthophosphate dikinase
VSGESREKHVYSFASGQAEGDQSFKELLGGKGANLAEMTHLGLPVPPGLTITTKVCEFFYKNGKKYPPSLEAEVNAAIVKIEKVVGAGFGNSENPLLVSVRSGARVSMPGMMDTILNLGLNDQTVVGLANQSQDERFAYDAYRRFIQMYADVVMNLSSHQFESLLSEKRRERGVEQDSDLRAEDLKKLVLDFKQCVLKETGKPFPQDIKEQLWGAIGAVFHSWMSARAVSYRRIHKIP